MALLHCWSPLHPASLLVALLVFPSPLAVKIPFLHGPNGLWLQELE